MSDPVIGLDIYHGDSFDPADLKAKGIKFVILKATQGPGDYTDVKFKERWASLKAHGIIRGAYHFFEASQSGTEQAKFFLKVMGELEVGDLPPTLDWESDRYNKNKYPIVPFAKQLVHAQAFMDVVEKATGMVPMNYTGRHRLVENHYPASWARYPLWEANYNRTATAPVCPAPYKHVTIWQKSDDAGRDAGIKGNGDFNIFMGSLDDLKALCKQPPKA